MTKEKDESPITRKAHPLPFRSLYEEILWGKTQNKQKNNKTSTSLHY